MSLIAEFSIRPKTEARKGPKEVTRSASFYFPSYQREKEKTRKSTKALDSSHKREAVHRPAKTDNNLPKQVSFFDDIRNSTPKMQKLPNQQLPKCLAEPAIVPTGLSLTTKNLEMYNTMSMTSELCVPSDDDGRVASWIKDRRRWTTDLNEGLPDVKEIESVLQSDSSTSSTQGYIN